MMQSQPSRLWFLARGYKQVPPEEVSHKVLWTDGVNKWFNVRGSQVKEDFSPSMRDKHYAHGHGEPKLRNYGNRRCRILMGVTFYGKRPFYKYKNGKMYPGIAHHLINDLSNYSKDNLLCWLTYSEHRKADNRRRALEAIVPDRNLHVLSYDRLRYLEDPRTLSDEDFKTELANLRDTFQNHLHRTDPLALAARDIDKYR